jgi:hypothetical protein
MTTRYNPDGFPETRMHVDPEGYWVGWDVHSILLAENRDLKSALIAIAEVEIAMDDTGFPFAPKQKLAVVLDIAKDAVATQQDSNTGGATIAQGVEPRPGDSAATRQKLTKEEHDAYYREGGWAKDKPQRYQEP